MAGMGIARFDNHKTKTSNTIVEFSAIPTLDCEEQYKTIKEELEKINKTKHLRKTFKEISAGTGFETLRVKIFKINTEDTQRILDKVKEQLSEKKYFVNIQPMMVIQIQNKEEQQQRKQKGE